jgi:hypothetical protein
MSQIAYNQPNVNCTYTRSTLAEGQITAVNYSPIFCNANVLHNSFLHQRCNMAFQVCVQRQTDKRANTFKCCAMEGHWDFSTLAACTLSLHVITGQLTTMWFHSIVETLWRSKFIERFRNIVHIVTPIVHQFIISKCHATISVMIIRLWRI